MSIVIKESTLIVSDNNTSFYVLEIMSIHFIDVIETCSNAYNTRWVKAKSKSFI